MHRVDLWVWPLTGGDARLLSLEERARARRFRRAADRDRFVAGRARLREILAGYLGGAPEAVRIGQGANGRPATPGIGFNLSHTEGRDGAVAALAVCAEAALSPGLDIEAVRPVEGATLRRVLTPGEQAALAALPGAARPAAFACLWTRKEALLKGLGTGFLIEPQDVEVTLGPEPRVLAFPGGAARWSLHDLCIAPDIPGALALRDAAAVEIVERLALAPSGDASRR